MRRKSLSPSIARVFFVLIFLLIPWAIANASSEPMELHYVIYEDGIPKEHAFIKTYNISPTGEKGYYYENEYTALLLIPGLNQVSPLVIHSTQFSNEEFRPQYLTLIEAEDTMTGYVDPITGHIRLESNFMPTLNIIPPDKEWYFIDHFILKLLAQGFEFGEEYHCFYWNENIFNFSELYFTFLEEIEYEYKGETRKVYKTSARMNGKEEIGYLDSSGFLHYCETPLYSLELKLMDKNEIPDLAPHHYNDIFIPANIQITGNLTDYFASAVVKLSWKTAPSDLCLKDNRQRVIEDKCEDADREVVLTLFKDPRDFTGIRNLDNAHAGLKDYESYIASTRFIESNDPEIINLARQVIGNEQDSWKATKLLLQWTNKYIEKSSSPPILNATNLLKTMKGGETSYSILFGALSRSLGIPTKLVVGLRLTGSSFAPHAWNEVWIGEWISVDPVYNQSSPSALYVKLHEGANEDIIFNYIQRTKNLKSRVLEATVVAGLDTYIRFKAYPDGEYVNNDLKFKFFASPDKWSIVETISSEENSLSIQRLDEPDSFIALLWSPVPPGLTAELLLPVISAAFMENFNKDIPSNIKLEVIKEGPLELDGKNNAFICYESSYPVGDGINISFMNLTFGIVIDNNKMFVVFYADASKAFDDGMKDLIQMLKSLETDL